MTSLIRESSSHQRSLRKHTPSRSKLHKTQSLTQPRDTKQGTKDPESTTTTFANQEPQTMDYPEPGMAPVLQEVKQQEVIQQEVGQQEVGQQEVGQQEVGQQEVGQQEVFSVCADQPYSEAAREPGESQGPKPALRPSSMLSLTINNRAMQLHCGLVKKCWSEMEMGSVNLPLYLTQTAAKTDQAPALTLPRPLLSALVPAPSPLPVSLWQRRRTPTSRDGLEDGLDAPMPWEDPFLARDPSTKRCLPGLCLFLSFFFPTFRSYPIYLPPSSRRIPG